MDSLKRLISPPSLGFIYLKTGLKNMYPKQMTVMEKNIEHDRLIAKIQSYLRIKNTTEVLIEQCETDLNNLREIKVIIP